MSVSWSAWGLVCISGCDIWGVVGIKCAGRNNFNTNHFQTSLILGFLKPSLSPYGSTFCNGPSTTGNRWRTRFCWGFRRPLQALLEAAPWYSERSANSDFTSLEHDKILLGNVQRIRRPVDHLDALPLLKVLDLGGGADWVNAPYRNSSWDDNPDLFGFKIG